LSFHVFSVARIQLQCVELASECDLRRFSQFCPVKYYILKLSLCATSYDCFEVEWFSVCFRISSSLLWQLVALSRAVTFDIISYPRFVRFHILISLCGNVDNDA